MNQEYFLSLVAVFFTIINGAWQYFSVIAGLKERIAKSEQNIAFVSGRIDESWNARLSTLEVKTAIFWKVVEDNMAELLKKPIHKKLDALLDEYIKSRENTSIENLVYLKEEIIRIIKEMREKNGGVKDPLLFGYILFLARIEILLHQRCPHE